MSKEFLYKKLPLGCFMIALVLFIFSMAGNTAEGDTEKIARRTEKRIERRIEILDDYIRKALLTDIDEQIQLDGLPEDMVVYRYVNDSLQSWTNQFTVTNDDISNRFVFPRLTNLRDNSISPLVDVKGEVSYMNLGPKWYIVKSVQGKNNDKIISGIEIKNTLIDDVRRTENGVNPHLKIPGRYFVLPLNHSGGSAVSINDIPLFKIIYDSNSAVPFYDNSLLRWIAVMFFAFAAVMFLAGHRTLKVYFAGIGTLTILFLMSYILALQMNGVSDMFSPSIYADGVVFFSLGALLLVNTYITLICVCTYMVRDIFLQKARCNKSRRRRNLILLGIGNLSLGVLLCLYLNLTLRSLIQNSNISMELYRWNSNVPYTATVYMSYVGLMLCVLLHIQTLRPIVRELFGIRYNMDSRLGLACFAVVCALYFSLTSGLLGFRKEQNRATVWANRLAVERDLSTEIQLRSVEESIASDQIIAAFTLLDNTETMILNRIAESYLGRVRSDNNMSVRVINDNDAVAIRSFNDIVRTGTPIANGSRFMFMTDMNGHNSYVGAFLFYLPQNGLTRMLLSIEPNSNKEDKGYYSILGMFSKPGDINIPSLYSYAKYTSDRLVSFKGNYPYPVITENFKSKDLDKYGVNVLRAKNYTHFVHKISDGELIVISRPQRKAVVFITSFSYLFLALLGILHLFMHLQKGHKPVFRNNYFRTRINLILFMSSFLILTTMTIASVLFVYKRNEGNMRSVMSSKISTIQALVEARTANAKNYEDLITPEMGVALENISNTTKSDITLYSPSGKVFRSTTPEVFDKMVMGSRINQDAFYNILHHNQRFYIHKEKISGYDYWAMYAPVFNHDREIVAIISVPYTDKDYDFRREAFFHAAMIINIFLILLIVSLLFCTREVNSMFYPLVEMGKKMNTTDIHNLEYIIYKREDEISSLVDAYNRMVKDLSDSTRQLAQAERDKAWSQMARQVAHEIKNPLTPIKLEIQRLIRLKQNGNPKWEEKFDKVASVVLEHIDILTDTANEFSTFAKLYSEEPVLLDLDKTLKDQLMIFDNRENIRISYIGMEKAYVMAPKPQLIRVFVNLLTNAIQAVEIQQREAVESGAEPMEGRVLICLRNSIKSGYYDIVFDDNGSGVKDENLDKLFTPNFTTKSSGTGLGLAICRNIIEKCDGEIRYQKSFALGGASFTVTLPVSESEA